MKTKILTILAILSMIGMASAFDFNKVVTVLGDYEWVGSWQKTNPITAVYIYDVSSPAITSGITNYDNLGTAWKYIGESEISVDKPATFTNILSAITVNEPVTTPATGGYTQYNYHSLTTINNVNAASTVKVDVTGEGYFSLLSQIVTDAKATQTVHVGINEFNL